MGIGYAAWHVTLVPFGMSIHGYRVCHIPYERGIFGTRVLGRVQSTCSWYPRVWVFTDKGYATYHMTVVPLHMGIGCAALHKTLHPSALGVRIHAYWVGCRAHAPGTLGYGYSWILGMLLWYFWVWGFPGY